ncbi:tyrosine-type recombinase/integrase [Methylobacterium sp. J-026]|uniref:tyrosine-type recombinase/integrase n=1 Tax=Methylobacterium sp. J-026 TaxID=2836624 RepID=UPI0011C829D5|nr:tyrosine-type recombinase/integrase [Methylobacterium sp. J-026]MCJ2136853.1 tyrosine-type recombinase/integrase [Methylobacterium sp. J-026]TXM71117.1 tyrosine-type recombinase/integrase [Methylobacterium sp. WL120]
MPRKPGSDIPYVAAYNGFYRVTMAVPKELRGQLGNRLVRGLDTKSVVLAKTRSVAVVAEFKKRIADAWDARGGRKHSLVAEALELRREMKTAQGSFLTLIDHQIEARAAEILNAGRREETVIDDEEGPIMAEFFTAEARREASEYRRIAYGKLTPIAAPHPDFMRSLKIKERSKLDEPRALNLLLDWMESQRIPRHVEAFDRDTALAFADWLQESSDLSWASKVKYFGRLKVYWAWLCKRGIAKANPIYDLTIKREVVEGEQEERAYTDTEVQTLFMGKPLEGESMLDVMAVAALTGARLDAVIDLKVGECAEGIFAFKPQKKETDERHVPIHPDLRPIVLRRIKGKPPTASLFEDWPGPKAPSKKPRSSYFSKRFTRYSREVAVRDEVEGKRRSLVNFHSFRRWFITKMERAGVNGDLIAAIVGHKRSGLTLGRYSSGPELQAALDAISLVKLPPLDGSPVVESRGLKPLRERKA